MKHKKTIKSKKSDIIVPDIDEDDGRRILILVMYLTAGVLLSIHFYDLQVGNITPGVKGGGTLPHWIYVMVLPALIHIMYKALKGESIWQKWRRRRT